MPETSSALLELPGPIATLLLPGLTVLVLLGLLFWILDRWYDPVPGWWGGAVGVILLLLLGPVLAGGHVLMPWDPLRAVAPFDEATAEWAEALPGRDRVGNRIASDLVYQQIPWRLAVRRQLDIGHWPLWNPSQGPGMPLLADPQVQALDPLTLPFLITSAPWPPDGAIAGGVAALRLGVALLFAFALLRRLGLSVLPSALGATSFGLGGFILVWLSWPAASPAVLLPALLYAIERVVTVGGRRDGVLLAAVLTALGLAGHPEGQLHVALACAAFALSRLAPLARRSPGSFLRAVANLAGATLVALALAAPALLPALDWLPHTHRAEMVERRNDRWSAHGPWTALGGAREGVTIGSLPPPLATAGLRLAPVVAPRSLGDERYAMFRGDPTADRPGAGFPGTVALLLAILSGLLLGRDLLRSRARWSTIPSATLRLAAMGLLGFTVLGFTALVIAAPPPWPWLVTRLPLLDASANFHARVSLLTGAALALLAAVGLERWLRMDDRDDRDDRFDTRVRLGTLLLAGGLTVGLVVGAFLLGDLALARSSVSASLVSAPVVSPTGLGPLGLQLLVLAIAVGALGAAVPLRQDRSAGTRSGYGRRRALAGLVVVVAAVELLWTFGAGLATSPRGAFFPVPPIVEDLQRLDHRWPGGRVAAPGSLLVPNLASVYGLADVRSSGPAKPWAMTRWMVPVTRSIRDMTDRLELVDHPRLDRLGARWVLLAAHEAHLADPSWWLRARREGLILFENPAARGLLRVEASPEEMGLGEMGPGELGPLSRLVPDHLRATWRSGSRQARAFTSSMPILTTTLFQDGHWRVLVDGVPMRDHPPTAESGPFVAARLPAGSPVSLDSTANGASLDPLTETHRLDLLYRPRPFVFGMLLAAFGLSAAVGWWARPPTTARGVAPR